jgi:mRNA-degrading endonuclease RelE of RelBE toxin-antitoxin system
LALEGNAEMLGKQLRGELHRCRVLRIGAYRLVYVATRDEVIVIAIGERADQDVYREAQARLFDLPEEGDGNGSGGGGE